PSPGRSWCCAVGRRWGELCGLFAGWRLRLTRPTKTAPHRRPGKRQRCPALQTAGCQTTPGGGCALPGLHLYERLNPNAGTRHGIRFSA
ncbi:MAG: hypothetical protein E7A35_22845, partial [Leclercia adecarboxylata]|nr:hypothetical protein [Leclercia adecarboxylata]